ncbi:MAG: hypothetical protein BGO01_07765 [Armatimonadetes bacterium 55-13]|nr:hypothetical protein [Armatimonadota bacterium]OJU63756.1 MAG: hypothetical protein BGO01_07765 [Armatimonadetes bacterium 55-13]
MLSRRDLLKITGQTYLAASLAPLANAMNSLAPAPARSVRSINVINFLRGVEPRGPVDLLLPAVKQMEITKDLNLPTTWLLQYDALVSGPFVKFLKDSMPKGHEVGVWFEMNEMHCKAAGVEWRGRPNYEWDHIPCVAFTIGYTEAERIKLADAFMSKFKEVWGSYPRSVASWNLDAVTMAHLVKKYGVDAFAVCRDQIATDGFTIWGAPFAGYYPSDKNCWSPALDPKHQISSPVLKMLGQDPVYYYESSYPMPDGRKGGPDTMEPVWPSGRSPVFIENFLEMIEKSPTLSFAYAQLGQENNFGWPEMAQAYPIQMKALAELRDRAQVHVETMGETGRRFKQAFKVTPTQAQVMLEDPFGNTRRQEGTIWYQSRFYRANLHLKGDLPFLRDLTVYSDRNAQPFLNQATRLHDVEQRMPAALDGFHWSKTPGSSEPGSGGYFVIEGERLKLTGKPVVREEGANLIAELPVTGGRKLVVKFEERRLSVRLLSDSASPLTLMFEWDPSRAAFVGLNGQEATYKWQEFVYSVKVTEGSPKKTELGWSVLATNRGIALDLAQKS